MRTDPQIQELEDLITEYNFNPKVIVDILGCRLEFFNQIMRGEEPYPENWPTVYGIFHLYCNCENWLSRERTEQ